MAQDKKQSFLKGTAILSMSTLLVKVLGLLFSIPLANIISTEGMSYFYAAYDIFGIFVMFSTAGLPIAVSRMVSTAYSQGHKKEADQVFSVAFWLFFAVGLAGCLVMFFCSRQIAVFFTGIPEAAYTIMALSPTIFFISVMSALRGYFQGRSNMEPTAMSQIIEAVTKVIIGVGLAVFIINRFDSDLWAAVGAITGVSVSAALGSLYLILYKIRQKKKDEENVTEDSPITVSRRNMLRKLLLFAVPITLGSCLLSLLDVVDMRVLILRLQDGAGFTQEGAEHLRGVLGHARKFFDLPGSFVVPVSTSLLPLLSGAVASDDKSSVNHVSNIAMRVTLLISVPCTVGMSIFAGPICKLLLFGQQSAAQDTAPLLAVLSIAIAFNSIIFTTNAMLQSFGRVVAPVVNMAVGGVLKIFLSYVLIGIPEINAMGSALSTVISYFVIMLLNVICISRNLPNMKNLLKSAVPVLCSAGVMGAVSYGIYYLLTLFSDPRVAVILAIIAAVAIYVLCVLRFKAVTYDDVIMLPKGEKIASLLKIKKE